MREPASQSMESIPTGLCEDPTGRAATLISRMGRGEEAALAELHEMWGPVLLGIACRMIGDRHDAEEIVQDAFVRMWHRAADYDAAQSPPFVWAFAVMRGLCIDRLRFRHRAKRDSSRVVPIHLHAPPDSLEDPRILAVDDWRRVRRFMEALPPDERGCLELAVFLEYTHSEISERLGTPLGTVKNRLRRALDKIREHMKHHEI